jgi:environmental stress-induced protein Ves
VKDLTPAAWRAQPWKNGRGVTHEIVRWPPEGELDVRVSFVELTEPGPFSTFPGYHRWTVPLANQRLVLHGERTYTIHGPGAFKLDGSEAVTAELPDGPIPLLNVIARPNLVDVGTDSSMWKVRFVFAYEADNELALPRYHARILEPRELVRGPLVWMYWRDWREDPNQVKKPKAKRKRR